MVISHTAERLARLEDMLQALQRREATVVKTTASIIAVVPVVTLAPVVAGSRLPTANAGTAKPHRSVLNTGTSDSAQ
jgi:hypothetical protein